MNCDGSANNLLAPIVSGPRRSGLETEVIMQIDLPYPPSSNRYWRNFRGRMVVSEEARNYKESIGLIANAAGLQPVDGDVRVMLHIRRPAKRRDLDNHVKVLLDSLQGHAYGNDNQIRELHITMADAPRAPGVTVTIEAIES